MDSSALIDCEKFFVPNENNPPELAAAPLASLADDVNALIFEASFKLKPSKDEFPSLYPIVLS